MDILTEAFALPFGLAVLKVVLMALMIVCVMLSPTIDDWTAQSSFHALGTLMQGLFMVVFIYLLASICWTLYGPASLSTSCDDLKEKLNSIRVHDLLPMQHDRIMILECAMGNVNHGQGVGFKLFHTVIDRRTMAIIGAKLGALISATAPFVIAVVSTSKRLESAKSAQDPEDQCDLNADQRNVLKDMARLVAATSAFTNTTNCNFTITLTQMIAMLDSDD